MRALRILDVLHKIMLPVFVPQKRYREIKPRCLLPTLANFVWTPRCFSLLERLNGIGIVKIKELSSTKKRYNYYCKKEHLALSRYDFILIEKTQVRLQT